MFERMIIATDLSPASFGIVNCLGGLKIYGAQKCLLLQCLSLQEVGSIALSYTSGFLQSTLEQQKQILEKQGFDVETRVIPGPAKREINRTAEREDYPLIVVGSSGHTLVGEVLFGSVANDVIHNARKPVLVIRLEPDSKGGSGYGKAARCNFTGHILYPTDFSENADRAFEYVKNMVAQGAEHVTLLHVQDKSRIEPHLSDRVDEFNKIDRGRLENLKKLLGQTGEAEVDIVLPYGSPFEEINKYIHEQDVNLVVMGSQGRGFVEEIFLGSVSHNVVRKAEVSVLLIPAKHTDA